MSTKAYYAYKLKKGKNSLFQDLVIKLKAYLKIQAQEVIDKLMCVLYIEAKLKNEEFSKFKAFEQIKKEHFENGFFIDGLNVYSYKGTPIVYSGLFEHFPDWFKENFEDFGYWNNTDKPEEISQREWKKRAKYWNDDNLDSYRIQFFDDSNFYLFRNLGRIFTKENLEKVFDVTVKSFYNNEITRKIVLKHKEQFPEKGDFDIFLDTKKEIEKEFNEFWEAFEKPKVEDFVKEKKDVAKTIEDVEFDI